MSKKIKKFKTGDCVEVATWNHDRDDFFTPSKSIGLILDAELIEMADESMGYGETKEWLYRVLVPSGKVREVWEYEIMHVNAA